MRHSASTPIPVHEIFRESGERVRPVTVRHTEGLLVRQKIWLAPHRRNYYLLMLLTQGSGRHWVDMVPHEFKADMLFFTTPQQVHAKENVETAGTVVCFTSDFFALEQHADLLKLPFIQNGQLGHQLILTAQHKAELRELFTHIITEYQQPADLQDEMLYAYLRVLLLYLSRLYTEQNGSIALGQRYRLYQRFQACIDENYKTIQHANAYAQMLAISGSHLNALIKEQSGKTVMTHLHNRQILEAKRLLFNTELSVKEIAFELGFRDTSYFNRFFKRLTSLTPLAYRAAGSE